MGKENLGFTSVNLDTGFVSSTVGAVIREGKLKLLIIN